MNLWARCGRNENLFFIRRPNVFVQMSELKGTQTSCIKTILDCPGSLQRPWTLGEVGHDLQP